MWHKMVFTIILGCLLSCSPYVVPKDAKITVPILSSVHAVMQDGYTLPLLQLTIEASEPRAIVLALHGMNDYSNSFRSLGEYLGLRNIQLIAYDQRGFGETKGKGYWHGIHSLTADLTAMCQLIKKDHPRVPLFLLGDSMGGAVVLAALESMKEKVEYDGIILIAPAVWTKKTMPWYQRYLLWFFAHTMPWMVVSADGLDIKPSDNAEMLRALGKDPLVIGESRIDTLHGMSELMDKALVSSTNIDVPTLLLYGEHDEIIPKEPICEMLKILQKNKNFEWGFILYPDGYHMLARDLQAKKVYQDIERWIIDESSGNDRRYHGVQAKDLKWVCEP
jgi:acylglycerol lipase